MSMLQLKSSVYQNGCMSLFFSISSPISTFSSITQLVKSLIILISHKTFINIFLSKIKFFLLFHFAAKIFNIWKANVRYRIFVKTRNRLIQNSYLGKPAFASHLMEMNKLIYDLQLTKTISSNLTTQNINWEVETFKGDQKKARSEASRHYDNVLEKLIIMCEETCKEVVDRTTIKESTDLEDTRFGKQVKQKAMNVIRKEKEERIRHLELAKQDKSKLRNFIRLVDYITLETLFKTNSLSIQSFLEEMKKENRKSGGLFNSTVIFDISTMAFTPDERDITETLMNILEDMVKIMKNTTRVIDHQGFDPFLKILGTATYADIQEIIVESVEFASVKEEINQKILQDFNEANKFVKQNYELCRPIHNDSSAWNQLNWEKDEHSLEEIKAIMVTLNSWKKDIKEKILDANKGIVNVNGARIRGNLGPHVNTRLDCMKDYLYKLMGAKSLETAKNLQDSLKISMKLKTENRF